MYGLHQLPGRSIINKLVSLHLCCEPWKILVCPLFHHRLLRYQFWWKEETRAIWRIRGKTTHEWYMRKERKEEIWNSHTCSVRVALQHNDRPPETKPDVNQINLVTLKLPANDFRLTCQDNYLNHSISTLCCMNIELPLSAMKEMIHLSQHFISAPSVNIITHHSASTVDLANP